MLQKFIDFLNHERYQMIAVLAVLAVCLWVYGCNSRTTSPTDPSKKVTRIQLSSEVDYYLAKAEIAYMDLDRQDEIKQKLMDAAAIAAQGGRINVVGLILANLGILGVGATVDNVRKRKVIKANLCQVVKDAKETTAKC